MVLIPFGVNRFLPLVLFFSFCHTFVWGGGVQNENQKKDRPPGAHYPELGRGRKLSPRNLVRRKMASDAVLEALILLPRIRSP